MTRSAEEIQAWLVENVAALTETAAADVDARAPWTRHGLDSVALISLAAELEKWLGYRFRENPLDAHRSIEELARFLAIEVAK